MVVAWDGDHHIATDFRTLLCLVATVRGVMPLPLVRVLRWATALLHRVPTDGLICCVTVGFLRDCCRSPGAVQGDEVVGVPAQQSWNELHFQDSSEARG